MTERRLLIAGIGNIFFGDDAFGVEVATQLADRRLPPAVCVADYGIRGFHLAYALHDGYDAVVLVDATPRGGRPGDLYLIEPECNDEESPSDSEAAAASLDSHSMDPVKVLRFARSLGPALPPVLLVGCEPTRSGVDSMQMGLSSPVQAAVFEAVQLLETLVMKFLAGEDLGRETWGAGWGRRPAGGRSR